MLRVKSDQVTELDSKVSCTAIGWMAQAISLQTQFMKVISGDIPNSNKLAVWGEEFSQSQQEIGVGSYLSKVWLPI